MDHLPYGVFNPRFYGVSIFLSDAARRDAFFSYMYADNVAEWSGLPRNESSDHATVSVVDHETRHFHDFLLSPLGTISMGLRMGASINGFQALRAIKDCQGTFVPVPLSRWIQWDPAARQRWIENDGSYFGITNPADIVQFSASEMPDLHNMAPGTIELPSGTPEYEASVYANMAMKDYQLISELRQQRLHYAGLFVCADDVFEATAHLVQLQAIWSGQSEASATAFMDYLRNTDAPHLQPLMSLWRLLNQNREQVSIQLLLELFTWMQLGNWKDLRSTGHPAYRFFQVFELATRASDNELFRATGKTAQRFSRLDAITQSTPWQENLREASLSADRRKERFQSMHATQLSGGFFDELFAVAAMWHRDQQAIRSRFTEDPESMTDPLRYIHHGGALPPTFNEMRFGSLAEIRETELNVEGMRAITIDPENRQVISYIWRSPGLTEKELDHVYSVRLINYLVDYLFEGETYSDTFDLLGRKILFQTSGKQVVSVY